MSSVPAAFGAGKEGANGGAEDEGGTGTFGSGLLTTGGTDVGTFGEGLSVVPAGVEFRVVEDISTGAVEFPGEFGGAGVRLSDV